MQEEKEWDIVIKADQRGWGLQLQQILKYRDLIFLFVKRDFAAQYKQTILGPLWFFIQPVLMSITYTVIFGNIAGISVGGVPRILFYLGGITVWNYFSETLMKTSDTFTANANLFEKVYFPRIITPLSIVVSNLIKLGVQLSLFLVVWAGFLIKGNEIIQPNGYIAIVPVLFILIGFLGLSCGILIASMTIKYRDLKYLVQFSVQLLMYATPIVYPLSQVPEKYKWLVLANPMTSIVEAFKYAFLGVGEFNWLYLSYSTGFTLLLFAISLLIFNRVEKSFVDTV
jgi:lipopolysaccharide transport system permease protein